MCAITWTDHINGVAISSTDPAGNVNYWWQQEGDPNWGNPQLVGNPLSVQGFNSYSEPTMAWTGDAVIIAAVDFLGNLDYWWQAEEQSNWHLQNVAVAATDGGILYTGPSITWAGNSVALVASDNSGGALTYWWQAQDTKPWNRQIVDTALQPAIARSADGIIIAAVDPEGDLKYWSQYAETKPSNPSTVASWGRGVAYSQPAIAWQSADNFAVITAVDSAGNLHYWWGDAGGWHAQLVASASGGVRYSQPSIAYTDKSRAVVITAVDSIGNLHYWWQPVGASSWNAQLVASASTDFVKYANPGIAWAPGSSVTRAGSVLIAAKSFNSRGAPHAINYWWQRHGASEWNRETVATYAPIT